MSEIGRLIEGVYNILENIRDFGHAEDCSSKGVPVYECCCYDKDQSEMAEDAIAWLDEELEF
jgi:hypothetical protein